VFFKIAASDQSIISTSRIKLLR